MWRVPLQRRVTRVLDSTPPLSAPAPALPQRRRSTGASTPPCSPTCPPLLRRRPNFSSRRRQGESLAIQLPWHGRSHRWRTPRIAAGSSSAERRLAPRGSLPALGRPPVPVSPPAPTPPQVTFPSQTPSPSRFHVCYCFFMGGTAGTNSLFH